MGCDNALNLLSIKEKVSIHAPAWGATITSVSIINGFHVSIHAPAWGATLETSVPIVIRLGFNPRTRMGCDTRNPVTLVQGKQFQSTHPHGVRQEITQAHDLTIKVSIHAPAWGATAVQTAAFTRFKVSIHAPAWGATLECKRPRCTLTSFNPRTRMGCDESTEKGRAKKVGFNPRTRMGCD